MSATNKKYPNNHVWPGVTALLYNVQLEKFFKNEGDNSIKEEYKNKLTDIGFEWKKSTDTNWNTISLKMSTSDAYISKINNINDGSEIMIDERYRCKRYPYNGYCVLPTRILIKNLEPNTSYKIRSYYICDDIKNFYNEQTVTTLANPSNITFAETVYEEEYDSVDEIEQKIKQREEIVKEIFDMFYSSLEKEYQLIIGYTKPEGMYKPKTIRFFPIRMLNNIEGDIWVFIHEMAHDLMIKNKNNWEGTTENYKNVVTKFMEFATNAPNATWKWISSHNNPIISSEFYDYMDNCLVVAACELSKGEIEPGEDVYTFSYNGETEIIQFQVSKPNTIVKQ